MEEVLKLHNNRKKMRKKTYNMLLKHIWQNFINVNIAGTANFFTYNVPPMILGHPSYDIDECCDWLIKEMEKKGNKMITVKKLGTNVLYISWKFK